MPEDTVFYLAYGSNADPERFRSRVGPWISRRAARLDGHKLRFAASVQSEGGGGAVIDEDPDGSVDGVLYEITIEQMEAMDREEFDPSRDISRVGRRLTVRVETDEGAVEAECYTVRDDGGRRAPSERYLGHILRGLESAGHPPEALERVRRAAG
ncbi:MAG: gamma-glutamylcyclotransferase [Acidobacteriota bacterium]|jgi:gamma-glutamylcyclotransferase